MKTEPTESLANQAIKKITDSLIFEINYEEDNYDAGYLAALHNHGKALYMMGFSEGQSSPKIKQLEWREGDSCFISITKFGQYTISKPTSLRDRQVFVVYFNEMYIKSWNTPEEAKAFVQEDFEKRVKECLISKY